MGLSNNLGKLSNMITSTGSAVGIAQPSPAYTLDVSGTGRFTSTLLVSGAATFSSSVTSTIANGYFLSAVSATTSEIYARIGNTSGFLSIGLESSTGGVIASGTSAYAAIISQYYNNSLQFATNNIVRATITGGGNVLIGTTDAAINSGVGIKLLNDTSRHISSVSSYTLNTEGEAFIMYSTGAGNYRFYVGWGGQIYATSTTISGISDMRLKENIRDINCGLKEIMLLKPREFDWKEGKGKNIKNDRGFIAQEFEEIFPDLIDISKDEVEEGESPYKSIRQDLIPVLVKAIQELKAEIDQLKNK